MFTYDLLDEVGSEEHVWFDECSTRLRFFFLLVFKYDFDVGELTES